MTVVTTNTTKLSASDDDLRVDFAGLINKRDVARLLEVDYPVLAYHLYKSPRDSRYKTFTIPKKSGGFREITAPVTPLKIIQRKLNQVLQAVYRPRYSVHGFTRRKNVRTNAQQHSGQRYVFNIDLSDFFPSINFGRVRGLFMSGPFNHNAEVATVLAQICCFDGRLPQGAPTSPVISNMICSKMDGELQQLAKTHRCYFTRYVDDMTFSTSLPYFPKQLGERLSQGGESSAIVGKDLGEIIKGNGFEINPQKVRLRTRGRRQEVTGLTTNVFPNVQRRYIGQIRAMLHAWGKFGLDAAQSEYWSKYDKKTRFPNDTPPPFSSVVKGKIEYVGMVRGQSDPVFQRLLSQLRGIAPELVKEFRIVRDKISLYVMTEGPTDPKHLRTSLNSLNAAGKFNHLDVEFQQFSAGSRTGSGELKQYCVQASKTPQSRPTIAVFDRDEPEILKDIMEPGSPFKNWGNNIFSFAIPVPDHRESTPDVCIELYYQDDEITQTNPDGRRIFLSNEFDPRSGRHNTEDLNCLGLSRNPKPSALKIVDSQVFNSGNENVALPKNDFADLILNGAPGFNDFSFDQFSKIHDIISSIAELAEPPGN